ncbi:hypothetical protein niasHS_018035 [Heterodera schachtii]|uniref:Uncharacterized protein n=1 Tax=Heterodera schachtii TaxID=97005 RepID=A0ABD2HWS3_HETSC
MELMDPEKGFYTKCEDKVTLTIDVITVDEPKMDKFIWDQSKATGTLLMDIEKVSEFAMEIFESERQSETVQIKGLPWKIWAEINQRKESSDNNEKWLGIYLWCDMPREDKNWSCKCSAILRIVSQMADYRREYSDQFFNNKSNMRTQHQLCHLNCHAKLGRRRRRFSGENLDELSTVNTNLCCDKKCIWSFSQPSKCAAEVK